MRGGGGGRPAGSTEYILRGDRGGAGGPPVGGRDGDQHGQPAGRRASGQAIFCLDPVVCPCSTMYRIHPAYLAWVLDAPGRRARCSTRSPWPIGSGSRAGRARPHAVPARARRPARRRGAAVSAQAHVPPPLAQVRAIVQRALDEDVAWGDVTTNTSVPAEQRSRAVVLAKQDGVLCGIDVFAETLTLIGPAVKVEDAVARRPRDPQGRRGGTPRGSDARAADRRADRAELPAAPERHRQA